MKKLLAMMVVCGACALGTIGCGPAVTSSSGAGSITTKPGSSAEVKDKANVKEKASVKDTVTPEKK